MSNQFNESTDSVKSKGALGELGKVFEKTREMLENPGVVTFLQSGYQLWVGDNDLGLPETDYVRMCFFEDTLCFGVEKLKLSGSEITDIVSIPLSRIVSVEDVEQTKVGKIAGFSLLAILGLVNPGITIAGYIVSLTTLGAATVVGGSLAGLGTSLKKKKSGYIIFYLDENDEMQYVEIKKSVFTGKKFHDFNYYLNENMKLIERDEKVLELLSFIEAENNKSIEEQSDTVEEREEALEELEEELAELEEEISEIQFTDDPKYIALNKKIEEIEKAIKQAKSELE